MRSRIGEYYRTEFSLGDGIGSGCSVSPIRHIERGRPFVRRFIDNEFNRSHGVVRVARNPFVRSVVFKGEYDVVFSCDDSARVGRNRVEFGVDKVAYKRFTRVIFASCRRNIHRRTGIRNYTGDGNRRIRSRLAAYRSGKSVGSERVSEPVADVKRSGKHVAVFRSNYDIRYPAADRLRKKRFVGCACVFERNGNRFRRNRDYVRSGLFCKTTVVQKVKFVNGAVFKHGHAVAYSAIVNGQSVAVVAFRFDSRLDVYVSERSAADLNIVVCKIAAYAVTVGIKEVLKIAAVYRYITVDPSFAAVIGHPAYVDSSDNVVIVCEQESSAVNFKQTVSDIYRRCVV